jgi:phosphoglycerate dehydrogenase-like enzyme
LPGFLTCIIRNMVLKVHYQIDPDTEALGILRSHLLPGVQLSTGQTLPSQPDFQVLINGTPTREQLVKSTNLESLVIPYAGIPQSTRRVLVEFPHIRVYNLHHNAAPTAEMAVALLLAAAKFLVPIDQAFRQGGWLPYHQAEQSMLLEGKTVLVLGFGQIGQRVGLICQALGMQVIGVRRDSTKALIPGLQAEVHTIDKLEQLLPRSQVLIITLPITEQTRGLVGARQLSRLIPGGLLVNVGRGNVVDQAALYQALTDGTLSAAGIDVWYNYPDSRQAGSSITPADFPFHQLDNVVMSPHRGGGSRDTERLRMHYLAELLNALHNGEPTPSQVDLSAGY